MSLYEYTNRNIPDYYPTMYQDGYSPAQILFAYRGKRQKAKSENEIEKNIFQMTANSM